MMGIGMTGFSLVSLLFMLLIWGALIALALALIKTFFSGGARTMNFPEGPAENPEEIINQRYARGEINREQYEQLKMDLRSWPDEGGLKV